MPDRKITLSVSDLHSPKVEDKLKQQAAVESAQASYKETASRPSRLPIPDDAGGSIWYNTIVSMTVFGLVGGLLAFGFGEIVTYFHPNQYQEALRANIERQALIEGYRNGISKLSEHEFLTSLHYYDARLHGNPYYQVLIDPHLSNEQRFIRLDPLKRKDHLVDFFSNVLFYSACGIMIAIALGMADSIATRNVQGAIIYGSVGAALGLIGGLVVSLFLDTLYQKLGGGDISGNTSLGRQILARSVGYGVLGIFLSAAPGIIMRNWRKLSFGILGGLIGGVVGGALFDPIQQATGSDMLSRLIAITTIGVITGVGTGLIENAAKTGWFKVVQGLIAGKQFIIYRNPTFIGSSPQCEIYLFKDNQVLRRHAVLHILPGSYEIEDLGTQRTLVNNRPIQRARLRNGDRVQIGRTCFAFHEKARTMD